MKNSIPTDGEEYAKIVKQVSLRMQASADWYNGKRARMRSCYERWHRYPARPIEVGDRDDYDIQLGYGFGIVEQVVAKFTEPLMNMGIPFGVFPTELGDQPAADNFADMCRDFYAKPHVQMALRKSKKEMAITGARVEIDEFLHVVEKGKRWGKVPKKVEDVIRDPETGDPILTDGKTTPIEIEIMVDGEIKEDVITHYGFNTRYPSVMDIHPEPNRTTIDTGQTTDIGWIVEELGELAIEDMVNQVIYDQENKQTRPRYDFTKLINDAGEAAKKRYANILSGKAGVVPDSLGPVIRPVRDWVASNSNSDNTNPRTSSDAAANESFEDRDKVWVVQMRTKNEIVTIANGRYIIERVLHPWHRPRLGVRIEVYTIDPRSPWGLGVLDPILDELDELDITHALGMQNLWRLVNKMLAVRTKAIVNMDDLNPRAGGIVRINDEVESAEQAVHAIVQPSAINEMLSGESNTKGNIEFTSSYLDGQPGVMGTKAQHKTARGQEILQVNINTRFATMQAQGLINEALRGQSMQYITEQFMWEPMSYARLTDDGATVYAKFTKDDINTEGRGFRFIVVVDPLWGNTHQQRQDSIEIFQEGVSYEEMRLKMGDTTMKKVQLSELYADLLKKSGRRDISKIFVMPNGEVSPEQELQVLINGGVVDGCRGDKQHHITTHLLQAKSPELAKAMAAGKAAPDTASNLMRLAEQAAQELKTFLANPNAAVQEKLDKAGMVRPGAGAAAEVQQ